MRDDANLKAIFGPFTVVPKGKLGKLGQSVLRDLYVGRIVMSQ